MKSKEELQKKYIDMIDNSIEMDGHDIDELIWDCGMKKVDEFQDKEHRWHREISTILQSTDGRYFRVDWLRGLTEEQENEFYTQPYEVELPEEEITCIVKVWKSLHKK